MNQVVSKKREKNNFLCSLYFSLYRFLTKVKLDYTITWLWISFYPPVCVIASGVALCSSKAFNNVCRHEFRNFFQSFGWRRWWRWRKKRSDEVRTFYCPTLRTDSSTFELCNLDWVARTLKILASSFTK